MQEFAALKAENTVYKLVGPVLVPQDQAEAKQNVDTRLDFIRGEMCVLSMPFVRWSDAHNVHTASVWRYNSRTWAKSRKRRKWRYVPVSVSPRFCNDVFLYPAR